MPRPPRRTMLRAALLLATAATLPAAPRTAGAQSFPDRPLRLVVPFAPGGFNDILARVLAQHMGPALGQPVVVENRAGGGGVTGSEAVARAAPDGYTLLIASVPHVVNAALHQRLPYDPIRGFAGVSLVASNPNVLVVHPSFPARSVAELVAAVRANPGRYSFGSNSVGGSSHLGMEMFRAAAGNLDMVHVPYRGSAAMQTDLLNGTVQLSVDNVVFQTPFVRDGKLRALAVTSRRRSEMLPDVPTLEESGFPGFEVAPFYSILVPAGTPRPVIGRLNAAILAALRQPAVQERLRGAETHGTTPEEADAHLGREFAKWTGVARAVGARAD